jgi:hypothetical protein
MLTPAGAGLHVDYGVVLRRSREGRSEFSFAADGMGNSGQGPAPEVEEEVCMGSPHVPLRPHPSF